MVREEDWEREREGGARQKAKERETEKGETKKQCERRTEGVRERKGEERRKAGCFSSPAIFCNDVAPTVPSHLHCGPPPSG